MTSSGYSEAYVWIWLPGAVDPVVAGRLEALGTALVFNYAASYLARPNAMAIYGPELPLRQGALPLPEGLDMPGSIRDGAPDAWGRRVILNRKLGLKGADTDTAQLDELTYLLESDSDRVGALDFQASPTHYQARTGTATLEELMRASELVEQGVPLTPDLAQALQHGTSLGGARPKAQIEDAEKKYIAKFSSSTDVTNVVKAEFVAMRMAAEVGITTAPVRLVRALGKDVLLVERFDREKVGSGWRRRAMVSALTILGLPEQLASYASYEALAEHIRLNFADPAYNLEELFRRLVFNVLCGNIDDHARNHAACWDGERWTLTPAYDVCPQPRAGNIASHGMLIVGNENMSRLEVCLRAAPNFLLTPGKAKRIVAHQVKVIQDRWGAVCAEAGLDEMNKRAMWRRQFLNPYAFEGLDLGELGIDL